MFNHSLTLFSSVRYDRAIQGAWVRVLYEFEANSIPQPELELKVVTCDTMRRDVPRSSWQKTLSTISVLRNWRWKESTSSVSVKACCRWTDCEGCWSADL